MALFFQIIGGIVITLIVLILAVYFFIKYKFKNLIAGAINDNMTPMVIHLNESFESSWLESDDALRMIRSLRTLGFEKGKAYDVIGMPNVKLLAFFKKGVSAVLYTYPMAGLWVDMVYFSESGEDVTVTNANSGSEIDTRPECTKIHMPDAPIESLWTRLETTCKNMSNSIINAANFRDFFEKSYQKDMAFIANKGGVTHEEFIKVHQNNPTKITDENLEKAFLETKQKEMAQWHDAVFQAHDLEDYDSNCTFFIVPETAHARAFLQYLADYDIIPEDAVAPLGDKYLNASTPDIFAQINKGFSEQLRASHVTSVELPLKAAVFSKPYHNDWD